jgi:hypothetical protein
MYDMLNVYIIQYIHIHFKFYYTHLPIQFGTSRIGTVYQW